MLKGPPARISGELAAAETVGFGMGRDGSQKVEEVKDDLGAGVGVDADGDEGGEGVAGKVGVLFADLEQLVGLPGDDSAGESAPAPF